jgi:hypothetical protein
MADTTYIAGFYTSIPTTDIPEQLIQGLDTAGFNVQETEPHEQVGPSSPDEYAFKIPLDHTVLHLYYTTDEDRKPKKPEAKLSSLDHSINPKWSDDTETYQRRMDDVLELVCRLAMALEAEYVPLINAQEHGMKATPSGRPISEAVSVPPPIGIYSPTVLDGFGGIESLTEEPPWYVAELTDGRTVVITTDEPWADGGWRPPTDAPYIERAWFNEADTDREQPADEVVDLSDPFAVLSPGDYGVDACVAREDIAAEFRNEDLRGVRVYVDEDRNLRRVADDTFVRNVVTRAGDDEQAVIEGMLADIPPDTDDETVMISALLHGAVPPSFVRLDAPDGENVVSRVLELDIETNKVDLLVSLGEAARYGEGLDTQTIESALDNLADLDDTEAVDAYIRENLL